MFIGGQKLRLPQPFCNPTRPPQPKNADSGAVKSWCRGRQFGTIGGRGGAKSERTLPRFRSTAICRSSLRDESINLLSSYRIKLIMNAVASIRFDRDYFNAYYANWVRYRSRLRRFAIPFALSCVAVTGLALWLLESYRPIAGGVFVFAVLNLMDAATHRLRWIRQRLASVAVDKSAKLTFTDDKVQIWTPNSEGSVKYQAFGLVTVTPDGIFLIPDSGQSIFIPRDAFSADDDFRLVSTRLA